MKRLPIFILFVFATSAFAQIEPPKPAVRVVPEKMTCKPGKLYKLPVTVKGDVKFDYDTKHLEAMVEGKTFTFVGPSVSVRVLVASADPFELQSCLIEVEGKMPPKVPPDEAVDAKLRRDMNAGFAKIDKMFAAVDARLAALEKSPPVDPPKPKPPVPTTIVKHLSFVGVTRPADASVVNDAELHAWFVANGIEQNAAPGSFGPFKDTIAIHKIPCIILQDAAGNIIAARAWPTGTHQEKVETIKTLASKYLPFGAMTDAEKIEAAVRAFEVGDGELFRSIVESRKGK